MPCGMSSSVMNFTVSAVKVAASVKPLPTAPDPSLLRGVAKAAGAGVADCAIPTTAHAAANAIMHSNKGSFRLVIASFLLKISNGCNFEARNSAVLQTIRAFVCQEWTGTKNDFSALVAECG